MNSPPSFPPLCFAKRVNALAVIELDGSVHSLTEEYDQFRDDEMKVLGLQVLRLKNEELFDMDNTLMKIKSFLDSIS
jgi:very-short-patch-repair endonuclease